MYKKMIKFISFCLMLTVILVGTSEPMAASQYNEDIIQIDIAEDLLNPEDFIEANNELVALGKVAMK